MAESAVTFGACHRAMRRAFREAGLETADLDARLLSEAIAGCEPGKLLLVEARPAGPDAAATFAEWTKRRLAGEPVARLTRSREFWSLDFDLDAEMLVPRPETEHLVAEILRRLPAPGGAPPRIADLGTGSGAILIALLIERPDAFGVGTDISLAALVGARHNAARLGVGDRAGFVKGNFAAPLSGFDVLVSNPPYIPTATIPALEREVREHDPRAALDGGADGLDCYRKIVAQARTALVPGGLLGLEIGFGQAREVMELLAPDAYANIEVTDDLAGIPRVVTARLTDNPLHVK